MLAVPTELQPVKDGLLEAYRLEIMAAYLHSECTWWELNPYGSGLSNFDEVVCTGKRVSVLQNVTAENVIDTINQAESDGRLHWATARSPWTAAQKIRRNVYQFWLKSLDILGTDTTESIWRSLFTA